MKINILLQLTMDDCCDSLPLAMNKLNLVGRDRLSSSHHQTHRTLPLISSHFLFVFLWTLALRNIKLMLDIFMGYRFLPQVQVPDFSLKREIGRLTTLKTRVLQENWTR